MRAIRAPIAILLAFVGFQCALYAQQDVITFTFNPPTPLSHTLTLKTTKIKGMGPSDTQTDVGVVKAKVSITKTSKGYRVVTTPSSISMTRNGTPMPPNPMVDRLMKVKVTCDLDPSGTMTAVRGYDEVIKTLKEELKTAMPAEQYKSLVASLPQIKDAAIAKEIVEWNGRIANFVGRTAKIGDTWVEDQVAQMPFGGPITFDMTTKIVEQAKRGKVDCVRIVFSYTTDAEGTKGFLQGAMDYFAKMAPAGKAPKIVEVKIIGGGERVVDPKTMMIYSETNDRTITMAMDDPDEGRLQLTMQEKREYTYQYGK